ncbi:hypothetical protein [Klebsiella variicola]|uniref:hypothetical protein n=1 Tax=Klebsiella variicola TaxID=244366 RepID=UPI001F5BB6D7|nr:hypothetical protein [Klebsiella variicola]
MTNNQLNRERLEKIKSWRETYGAGSNVMLPAEEAEELARIALAAMDSEPVAYAWVSRSGKKHLTRCEPEQWRDAVILTPLYRHAQPALTSESITVTDDMAYAFHHALTDSMIGADDVEEIKTGLRAVFANLTAPVVSAEYPDRLPCSVLLEPGLRFGKGIKTSTMLAALARRAVHESDMAALSPEEKAEFQARIEGFKALIAQPVPVVPQDVLDALQKVARIRLDLNDFDGDRRGIADCLGDAEEALIEVVNRRAAMLQDAENAESRCGIQTAPALDSFKKNAESRCGNAPVIPDGYVMVPVEPNGDMLAAAQDAYGETDGDIASTLRAAMLSGGKP